MPVPLPFGRGLLVKTAFSIVQKMVSYPYHLVGVYLIESEEGYTRLGFIPLPFGRGLLGRQLENNLRSVVSYPYHLVGVYLRKVYK